MPLHVDLIENRWSGGFQERVATVYVKDGRPKVDGSAHYRDVVLNGMPEDAEVELEEFLCQLPQRFHSDYFFASHPHETGRCPFANGDHVYFEQSPATSPATHA